MYSAFCAVGGTLFFASGSASSNGDKLSFIGTYDGETLTFYEDGSSVGTDTDPSGDLDYSTGSLAVGNDSVFTSDWLGISCENAVWSADIGATMIAALGRGAPVFIMRNDILLFYTPLWGNNSPETDYVGQLVGTVSAVAAKADWHAPVELLENYL